MKKTVVALIAVAILLSLGVTAFAAPADYKLEKLELTAMIPDGYSVVTRDTAENDPAFKKQGTTKAELMKRFESESIYLLAKSDKYDEEIIFTMDGNTVDNFSLLSDTVLETMALSLAEQFAEMNIEVTDHKIYQHKQAKFIVIAYKNAEDGSASIQYYTIYGSKAINITLTSKEESTAETAARQEQAIKAVVDGVKFDKAPPAAKLEEETDAFSFADADSGVTFTVPENWKQEELTEDKKYIDAKFVSVKEPGCLIMFGSTDLWAKINEAEKKNYARSDMNNSFFTKANIAGMFGLKEDDVTVETYNGIQYYMCEYTASVSAGFSVKTTQLIYIDNGWMYVYQFGGKSTHKLFADFETLMNSVEYELTVAEETVTPEEKDPIEELAVAIVASLVIVAVLVAVIILVIKKKKND